MALALVRCNSISCYNMRYMAIPTPRALVRCNSISCYNPTHEKSPFNRGFGVIEF